MFINDKEQRATGHFICPFKFANPRTSPDCEGRKCMMWRWQRTNHNYPYEESDTEGYCGFGKEPAK